MRWSTRSSPRPAAATSRGCSPCSPPTSSFERKVPTGRPPARGADNVAAQSGIGSRPDALTHPVLVDGLPGLLVTIGGRPDTVVAFTVSGGAITAMRALTDPNRLAQVVPSWVA
ncbi:MAG: hypothetical protein ACRDPO_02360 [Streptosporangiaceae bacterium]